MAGNHWVRDGILLGAAALTAIADAVAAPQDLGDGIRWHSLLVLVLLEMDDPPTIATAAALKATGQWQTILQIPDIAVEHVQAPHPGR